MAMSLGPPLASVPERPGWLTTHPGNVLERLPAKCPGEIRMRYRSGHLPRPRSSNASGADSEHDTELAGPRVLRISGRGRVVPSLLTATRAEGPWPAFAR